MNKLVTVGYYLDLNEAYIIKGLLESAGIKTWIFDEHAAAYTPFVIGGVRLMVQQLDLDNTRKVLCRESFPDAE
jgi:hypothetical protein